MFNLFRQLTEKRQPDVRHAAALRSSGKTRNFNAPLPLPEVIEGNEQSDWALWEDSVFAQDSQAQPLTAAASVRLRGEAQQSQFDNIDDVFSSVSKNGA